MLVPFLLVRKMGLEPTRHCCHKILSLARLPIPTLPRSTGCIILYHFISVKHILKIFFNFFQTTYTTVKYLYFEGILRERILPVIPLNYLFTFANRS